MPEPTVCPYCGAYSRRSCEWEEMTDTPRATAPCNFDEWDRDPDRLREDRDERKQLEKEYGE